MCAAAACPAGAAGVTSSIFGSLNSAIATPSRISAAASPRYGCWTDAASASRYASAASGVICLISADDLAAVDRISNEPKSGAMVVPSELKAWVSVSRDDAVSGLPSAATNGFAATCSSVMPEASTNSASRNSSYDRMDAAG